MADRLKDHSTSTGVKDGYANSEHEQEVSGMRHAPEDRERKHEAHSDADINEDVNVHQLPATQMSEMEKRQEEEVGGSFAHRAPAASSKRKEMSDLGEEEIEARRERQQESQKE